MKRLPVRSQKSCSEHSRSKQLLHSATLAELPLVVGMLCMTLLFKLLLKMNRYFCIRMTPAPATTFPELEKQRQLKEVCGYLLNCLLCCLLIEIHSNN